MVKVEPTPNNGSAELVPLHITKVSLNLSSSVRHFATFCSFQNSKGHKIIWFVFQKLKYIYDDEEAQFRAVTFATEETASFYQQAKGHEEDAGLAAAKEHYGDNR